MLEDVRQLIKNEAEEDDWKYHIVPVVFYAKKLAKMLKADEEIVELAALLHDIGRLRIGPKDHEITGVVEVEKILKKYNYSQVIINEIKHCVESHRASGDYLPRTIEAKIISNADAMAHFDTLPVFFYWRHEKGSFEEAFKWVDEKIERDWNKKLTLLEAKEIMAEKYKAIKLILDSNKKFL